MRDAIRRPEEGDRGDPHIRVVIAARPQSLVRIAGLPLVVRTATTARRAGFDDVVVVTDDSAAVERALAGHLHATGGVEVSDRLASMDGGALMVVAGDILVSAEALVGAAAAAGASTAVLVTYDGAPVVACGPAASLGAGSTSHALRSEDCGRILSFPPGDGSMVVAALDGATRRIAGARDVADAERALCAQLRSQSAATDGFLARLDRRVSCRISRWIASHTRLRPNHITLIGTAIGLCAALAFAQGTYVEGVAASLLFVLAAIIDGCDGEVARLTFRESKFGERLDVATDNVVHLAIFIGLVVGLRRSDPGGPHAILGVILLSGFALDGALSYYFLVVHKQWRSSAAEGLRQRVLKGLEALMNRDFAYVLLVLAVAGRLHWFLWGAAIGSYVFAALFVMFYAHGEASR